MRSVHWAGLRPWGPGLATGREPAGGGTRWVRSRCLRSRTCDGPVGSGLRGEVPEEKPGHRGDHLHPETGFFGVGLARVRTVGVGHVPEALKELPAVFLGDMAAVKQVLDRSSALVSSRLSGCLVHGALVAGLVLGEARDKVLEGSPQVPVRRFVFLVDESVDCVPVVVQGDVVATGGEFAFQRGDLRCQRHRRRSVGTSW